MNLGRWLQGRWYERRLHPLLLALLPLHGLFCTLAAARRSLYRRGVLTATRLPVPVVVVGNITVGGAGKTPLTLWLAQSLQTLGWRPGIISRGYGGSADQSRPVAAGDDPAVVGDEPLLLAKRSGLPVWIGRQRAEAGQALLAAHPEVNILLCDDGLQHYALAREVEIAVLDGRGWGNGWRLPMGPLREAVARLGTVDAVVCNGLVEQTGLPAVPHFDLRLSPGRFYRLDDPGTTCAAGDLRGKPMHALAGIGHPQRFFDTLTALGLQFTAHPFPDHHAYSPADLAFAKGGVLLMTEKDAVKCRGLLTGETWVLPVAAEVKPGLMEIILEKIRGRTTA